MYSGKTVEQWRSDAMPASGSPFIFFSEGKSMPWGVFATAGAVIMINFLGTRFGGKVKKRRETD